MAKGTYSSIMRLVVTRDIPQATPAIKRLMLSIQMFINCVRTAPTAAIHPVISIVRRLPKFSKYPALSAPMHAPIL